MEGIWYYLEREIKTKHMKYLLLILTTVLVVSCTERKVKITFTDGVVKTIRIPKGAIIIKPLAINKRGFTYYQIKGLHYSTWTYEDVIKYQNK